MPSLQSFSQHTAVTSTNAHTQSATQLVGSGSWYQESLAFVVETPVNRSSWFLCSPPYPIQSLPILQVFTQKLHSIPSESFGGTGGSPNSALLVRWALAVISRALCGRRRIQTRQTLNALEMQGDVIPHNWHLAIRTLLFLGSEDKCPKTEDTIVARM